MKKINNGLVLKIKMVYNGYINEWSKNEIGG